MDLNARRRQPKATLASLIAQGNFRLLQAKRRLPDESVFQQIEGAGPVRLTDELILSSATRRLLPEDKWHVVEVTGPSPSAYVYARTMPEVQLSVRRSMQSNRSRDTRPELALRSILHARGMRYRVSYRPLPGVRHTADVVFIRARVAVFVDGCWWHGCPQHYKRPKSNIDYWLPKIERNVERDAKVDHMLAEAGWIVIRAWEHEDPVQVADRVERAVRDLRDL